MSTAQAVLDQLSTLNPVHLDLVNESMQHAGYYEGKQSHFKLTIVSDAFMGLRLVARHQRVYALLDALLTSGGGSIHALAIHAYTTQEWAAVQQPPASPQCAGSRVV